MRCDRHPPARTARTRASRCGLRRSHSSAPRARGHPLAGRAPPLGGVAPPGAAVAQKKGRRPIAPPRLFVLWNHPCQNRSLPGRLNVWTRIWRSLPRPVPMLISENVGECARPRCYRVSVTRTTGPDPAISSVFTGLASPGWSLLSVATVIAYSVCSPCARPYSDVRPSAANGRFLPADGTKERPEPGGSGRWRCCVWEAATRRQRGPSWRPRRPRRRSARRCRRSRRGPCGRARRRRA